MGERDIVTTLVFSCAPQQSSSSRPKAQEFSTVPSVRRHPGEMSWLRLGWPATPEGLLRGSGFGHSGHGDEERLGLAQRDELSHTYGDEGEVSAERGAQDPPGTPPSICPRITTWEAGWNVTNAIQGIFVLGLPYALLQSGYLGLLLLVLAAVICSYTGKILISCLYEEDEEGRLIRVRNSYEDVANACCAGLCPRLGGVVVNAAQVVELSMTCVLYLVVSSNLVSHSFLGPPLPLAAWSMASVLPLVPCVLIRDLRVVSRLSLLCSLAQFLITFTVVACCLTQAHRWCWRRMAISVDFEKLLVSIGVIIFSYTSQVFLPTLEGSMEERGNFSSMMTWTHVLACVFKTAFSMLAFLTWGEDTKEVITDNLPAALRTVVNLCLLAKALLSYPLPFYAAAEVLQGCVSKWGADSTRRAGTALALRGCLLLLTFLIATFVPHFSLLMGLTGSVTGAAMTFLLPSLFHLQLKWSKLSRKLKIFDVLIVVLGSLCSLSGIVCSVKGLIEAFGRKQT
ncbi:vesicular inhibitory amino acid transporter [Scleropages formosus]|uniref:Vesicular inhibitory amino acid transporter n=1 Tax=Scleropages formosus TaxID=113540 RepID=A0A8C9S3Y6_SCLFO|nr:vesicular inhibitory amino acid transporter-like [Scleropages formosus]